VANLEDLKAGGKFGKWSIKGSGGKEGSSGGGSKLLERWFAVVEEVEEVGRCEAVRKAFMPRT
jgi:hypothetical protein